MLVEINTDKLIELKITPNQFVIINYIFEQNYGSLELFLKNYDSLQDLLTLEKLEYFIGENCIFQYISGTLQLNEIPTNLQKMRTLFNIDNSCFWNLFSTYPIKVPSGRTGRGYRILKPSSMSALMTKKMKHKYDKIIGKSVQKHAHIMRCLEAELYTRRIQGSITYMQSMEVWLDEHTWEKYEHLLEEVNAKQAGSIKYGETII